MSFRAEHHIPNWQQEEIVEKILRKMTAKMGDVIKVVRPNDERLLRAVNSENPLISFSQEQYIKTMDRLIDSGRVVAYKEKFPGNAEIEETIYDVPR